MAAKQQPGAAAPRQGPEAPAPAGSAAGRGAPQEMITRGGLEAAVSAIVRSEMERQMPRYLERLARGGNSARPAPEAAPAPGGDKARDLEGAIRASLSELPHVKEASYRADGDDWFLTVVHDYDSIAEAVTQINRRLRAVERAAPGAYIDARITRVPEAGRDAERGARVIL